MKINKFNWRNVKLGQFITDVAIDSAYSRQIAADVIRSFTHIFPKYLIKKREVHIPNIGTFYLKKSERYITKTDTIHYYDQVKFRPSRKMKAVINERT